VAYQEQYKSGLMFTNYNIMQKNERYGR